MIGVVDGDSLAVSLVSGREAFPTELPLNHLNYCLAPLLGRFGFPRCRFAELMVGTIADLLMVQTRNRLSLSMEAWEHLERGLEQQLLLYIRDQQGLPRTLPTSDAVPGKIPGAALQTSGPTASASGTSISNGNGEREGGVGSKRMREEEQSGEGGVQPGGKEAEAEAEEEDGGMEIDSEGGEEDEDVRLGMDEGREDDEDEGGKEDEGDPEYGESVGGSGRSCGAHNGHGWRCKKPAKSGSRWCEHHFRLRERLKVDARLA